LSFIGTNQIGARYRQYFKNCQQMIDEIADASYIFLEDANDVISCLPLREETQVVQLWHGCGAFKKWGISTAELKFGGDLASLKRHPFYKNLDLVTVSSPEVIWAYKEAMDLEETDTVQPLGVSRTDIFFNQDFLAGARAEIEALVPQAQGKKIILYAPTFRGRVKSAKTPARLDVGAFYQALGQDYVLLINSHPFVQKPFKIAEEYENFAIDVSGLIEVDRLLCQADVCITDYSSIIFEYALFNKPLLLFAFDQEEYVDWRGFYYPYEELAYGPICTTNTEMIDYIKNIDTRFDEQAVKDFCKRFMASCDGHSTQRILEYVGIAPASEGEFNEADMQKSGPESDSEPA